MRNWVIGRIASTLAVSWVVLAQVTGCGGGSSGGSGSAGEVSPLRLSPSAVSASTTQGQPATLTATMSIDTNTTGANAYIGMADPSGVALSLAIDSTSADSATVTISSVTTLAVGVHSGKLNFYACKDSACKSQYSSVPAVLSYTITVTPAPPAAMITPSPLVAVAEAGDPLSVRPAATLAANLNASGYRVDDSNAILSPIVAAEPGSSQNFTLTLSTLGTAVPGTYSGTFSLHVCSSPDCSAGTEFPGSPVDVPYTITIVPATPLVSPPTASGLPEWEMHQGNAAHTGFVPVTLDATRFAPGWTWALPASVNGVISPVTIGSGRVVASVAGNFQPAYLFAINEADGTLAWQYDLGTLDALNEPTVSGGRVFVASSGQADTFMWSFDLGNGALIFRTPFSSQFEHYLAPTFKDGFIYTDGGTYGGMYRFKGRTGLQTWFATLGQYDLWTPAVDSQYAYAYTGYEFAVLDRDTGTRVRTISDTLFNWRGYSLNIAPVLPGDGSVLLVNGIFVASNIPANQLIRFDLTDGTGSWRVDGQFASDPVVAAGITYVLNTASNQLEARDLATGALLWAWQPTGSLETFPIGNLILTQNLVFLGTTAATYAIDLTTHLPVWTVPLSGRLALSSNSILYIVPGDGTLRAYTLN